MHQQLYISNGTETTTAAKLPLHKGTNAVLLPLHAAVRPVRELIGVVHPRSFSKGSKTVGGKLLHMESSTVRRAIHPHAAVFLLRYAPQRLGIWGGHV